MEKNVNLSYAKMMMVDFSVGTISSFIREFVGYPFDFIKTRLQVQTKQQSAIKKLQSVIKKEGFMSLYRGISSQLLASVLVGSVYFTSYEFARRQFALHNGKKTDEYLPLYHIFLSGSFAGIVSDIASVPLEYGKIQIQKEFVDKSTKMKERRGPLSLLYGLFRERGIKNIYKGFTLQIARDFFGCGFFFLAYDQSLKYFTPPGLTRKDVSTFGVLVAGTSAGLFYWSFSYPIDLVKTRIQGDSIINPKYKNTLDCVRMIFQEGGFKNFYRGYGITVIRSIGTNICSLFCYEHLHNFGYNFIE